MMMTIKGLAVPTGATNLEEAGDSQSGKPVLEMADHFLKQH
jgi:hypothetical protein